MKQSPERNNGIFYDLHMTSTPDAHQFIKVVNKMCGFLHSSLSLLDNLPN